MDALEKMGGMVRTDRGFATFFLSGGRNNGGPRGKKGHLLCTQQDDRNIKSPSVCGVTRCGRSPCSFAPDPNRGEFDLWGKLTEETSIFEKPASWFEGTINRKEGGVTCRDS